MLVIVRGLSTLIDTFNLGCSELSSVVDTSKVAIYRLYQAVVDSKFHVEKAQLFKELRSLWPKSVFPDKHVRSVEVIEGIDMDWRFSRAQLMKGFLPEGVRDPGIAGSKAMLEREVLDAVSAVRRGTPGAQRQTTLDSFGLTAEPRTRGREEDADGPVSSATVATVAEIIQFLEAKRQRKL